MVPPGAGSAGGSGNRESHSINSINSNQVENMSNSAGCTQPLSHHPGGLALLHRHWQVRPACPPHRRPLPLQLRHQLPRHCIAGVPAALEVPEQGGVRGQGEEDAGLIVHSCTMGHDCSITAGGQVRRQCVRGQIRRQSVSGQRRSIARVPARTSQTKLKAAAAADVGAGLGRQGRPVHACITEALTPSPHTPSQTWDGVCVAEAEVHAALCRRLLAGIAVGQLLQQLVHLVQAVKLEVALDAGQNGQQWEEQGQAVKAKEGEWGTGGGLATYGQVPHHPSISSRSSSSLT